MTDTQKAIYFAGICLGILALAAVFHIINIIVGWL